MSDQEIEKEIQAKGLTAPRVTPQDIENNIKSEHYFTAEHGQLGYEHAVLLGWQEPDPTNPKHWSGTGPLPESLGLLTFCVLVLRNGFTVTGESACASPENFDEALGRKIARQNAIEKIWPLMGYELKQRLYQIETMRPNSIGE